MFSSSFVLYYSHLLLLFLTGSVNLCFYSFFLPLTGPVALLSPIHSNFFATPYRHERHSFTMHIETAAILAAYFGLSSAMPMASYKTLPKRMLRGRQVPQEHSHEPIIVGCNEQLKSTNTANIQDCIFGLLGNAAASVGQGDITNTDCLHKGMWPRVFYDPSNLCQPLPTRPLPMPRRLEILRA